MTLFLSFFFILSSNVIIFNLPSSQGISSGYHQSTLSQVLTPSERLTYILFGTLPNRIYYSYSKRSYVVRGQPGAFKNDLRTQRGKNKKGYKVMPRWKYYLSKFSPVGLIKTGMEYVSFAKALLGFGRGFKDFDDTMGDMGDLENPDDSYNDEDSDLEDDAKDGANGDAKDGAKDDAKDGAKDEAKDDAKDGAKDGANNNANGGNNNEKDWSGMFPSLPTFPTDLSSLYGDSNDGNKDNNNDKKEDKNDKKEDDKKEDDKKEDDKKEDDKKEDDKNDDSVDYTEMAKEAMQSDTAKDLVKTGISLFVPGGPAIVAAMEAGSKLGGATDAVEKVPKLKI